MTSIVMALLFAHFVGDWLLQPRPMAVAKSKGDWLALILHCVIVGVVLVPVGTCAIAYAGCGCVDVRWGGWPFGALNAVLHGVIDRNIWRLYHIRLNKKGKGFHYWNDYLFFLTIGFDQFLHVSILLWTLDWMWL